MKSSRITKSLLGITLLIGVSVANANIEDVNKYKTLFQASEFKAVVDSLKALSPQDFSPEIFTYYVYSLSRIDLDDAENAADKAISVHPKNADMYLMHADIMGQQAQDSIFSALGYAEKALNSLEKAAELEPTKPKYLNGLMSFYLAAPSIAGGDTDKALEQAKAIAKLDQEQGYAAMARYYQATDENESALNSLNEGLAAFPNSITLMGQLANFHLNNEDYQSAIQTLVRGTSIEIAKPDPSTLDDEDTKQKYENNVVALLNSHYQIGRVALIGETDMETGVEHLTTYIGLYDQVDVDISDLPSKEWAYLRQAGLLFELGEIEKASTSISMIKTPESDQMKKIHKSLNRKIKKALKKLS